MKIKAEDGKLYAEITLRDVVDKSDVSYLPMLAEVKRLYAENDKLRKYAELYVGVVKAGGCDSCPYCDDFDTCRDMEVGPMSEGCALYIEMRGLGIEVD